MNCTEFQSQMDRSLEERCPLDETALGGHAASCADCRPLWEDWLLLERAIGQWNQRGDVLDSELTDRVIEAARREGLVSSDGVPVADAPVVNAPVVQPNAESSHRRSIWPLLVTAALVLLAVLIVFREKPNQVAHQQPEAPGEPTRLVTIPDRLPVPDIALPEEQPDLNHVLADARSAWKLLTQRAAAQASDLRVFVPDIRSDIGLEAESETQPEDDPENGVLPMPLPDGVNRAFDFLFEAAGDDESQTT